MTDTKSPVPNHQSPVSDSNIAVSVKDLSKSFRMYSFPAERLKEFLHPFGKKYHRKFWALKDINFEIPKGTTFGIIGQNGSGKSTLLQIITGILQPTTGSVQVNGRVSALLELGAGFNPGFTGRENVYMNGAIMGLSRDEIDKRFEEIAVFADIGDFIDQPVKTYSSGMYVRLAFSVAINVDPDILVVDEVLAVGDMFFKSKCVEKIKQMIEKGITLVFVSHDSEAVKSLCKKSILLNKGELIDYGESSKVVEKYFSLKVQSEQYVINNKIKNKVSSESEAELSKSGRDTFINNAEFQKRASFQRIQNGKASFVNVQLLYEDENEIHSVEYDQNVILRMAVEINENIDLLSFAYHIRDKNGVEVVYSGSNIEDKNLHLVKKGEKYIIDWRFRMSLMQGIYNFACAMAIPIDIKVAKVDFCDFIPLAVQFEMSPREGAKIYGFVHWENEVVIEKL